MRQGRDGRDNVSVIKPVTSVGSWSPVLWRHIASGTLQNVPPSQPTGGVRKLLN